MLTDCKDRMTLGTATQAKRQKEKHFARREKVYGQFFTPPQVADFMIRFALASGGERYLGVDPACGDGVFLRSLLAAGYARVLGVDLDPQVLNKLRTELDNRVTVFSGDGLQPFPIMEGIASVVVGNPPFSAKYGRVTDVNTLSNFELGKGRRSQAIELLFLERFLQLVSPAGVVGIILPQGVLSAVPLEYVRRFLVEKSSVLGIVSLPRGIFSNGTTSKTAILFLRKQKRMPETFMAIVQHVQELEAVLRAYVEHRELEFPPAFWVKLNPASFEPEFYLASKTVPVFKAGLPVEPLGSLLSCMRCGRTEYGERRRFTQQGIPFISAKCVTPLGIDFSRNERYVEPNSIMDKRCAHVSPGDVLFVRVGVGCSGRASAVVDSSEAGVADDWIYILRPREVSPFYLALFFYTRPGRAQIERLKHGVGTVNIPQRLLKEILVPIPPESFQKEVELAYREMVRLRRAGHLAQARQVFEQTIATIESRTSE